MISGNKGEWSEIYVFLRLLADGKLHAANEQMEQLHEMFFPIIKIIREETQGEKYEYFAEKSEIKIYLNGENLQNVSVQAFGEQADYLYNAINTGNSNIKVDKTETFIKSIYITKLKAPTADKSDINIQLHDFRTGYESLVGFSIKSEIGSPPTLLNASKATNFIYTVENLADSHITTINNISARNKILDRMQAIQQNGGKLTFANTENATFANNLAMIDSHMPLIISEMLTIYYTENLADLAELTARITAKNPLNRNANFYRHKIKELLCAVALGLKPSANWSGLDDVLGGYIIVKKNGDIVAYHIYNRDAFKEYLLANTKLERASTTRHNFAKLYSKNNKTMIKLNLQIRFKGTKIPKA